LCEKNKWKVYSKNDVFSQCKIITINIYLNYYFIYFSSTNHIQNYCS
jgi:hypothetical protein